MEQIVVGMAECGVADGPGQLLVTFGLGSCIGATFHDPVAGVGGLLHFMLPDSKLDPARARVNPYVFADTAIPAALEALRGRGAARERLVAHAAGGASLIGDGRTFEIGRKNYEAFRRELARAGVPLRGEAVGGAVSRNLRLDVATGRIWLWEGGMSRYVGHT
jgi:chemotaxis protein CheD